MNFHKACSDLDCMKLKPLIVPNIFQGVEHGLRRLELLDTEIMIRQSLYEDAPLWMTGNGISP
jgi:hypothetical protein